MKKILTIAFAAAAAIAFAQEAAPAGGGGTIKAKAGACVAKVTTDEGVDGMKTAIASEMKGMSAEDQVAFVAAINEAIASLPDGEGNKDGYFAAANDAALQNASPGNVARVLAETFATVPAESLGAVTEALSQTINENSKASGDGQAVLVAAAKNAVAEVEQRTVDVDNAGARKDAVVALFSGLDGAPGDLADILNNPSSAPLVAGAAGAAAEGEGAEDTPADDGVPQTEGHKAQAPVIIPSAANTLGLLAELGVNPQSTQNPENSSVLSQTYDTNDNNIDAGQTTNSSDSGLVNTESSGYFGQTNTL